jgi:ankyrin repeat protein
VVGKHRLTPRICTEAARDTILLWLVLLVIDIWYTYKQGWTALMSASRCGHPATVQMLLEAGADPGIRQMVSSM